MQRIVIGLVGMVWLVAGWLGNGAESEKALLRGIWLGQDGHDYCQTSATLGPNDIQDLHVRLEGLLPEEEVDSVLVRRYGGGEWAVNGKSRSWKGRLDRDPKVAIADLYLEPSHDEPGCRLDIEVHYRSGKLARCSVKGGRSNPNLFMPGATFSASWDGQEGHDWTGPGPAVGPDGLEDARLELAGVSSRLEIQSIRVEPLQGAGWEYGLNPRQLANAELIRDQQGRYSLFFSPDRDLAGEKLTVRITYKIDRGAAATVLAGKTDPHKAMPKPPPIQITPAGLKIDWLGQDGKNVIGSGDLHVALKGLSAARQVLGAALSDSTGGYWIYRRDAKVAFYPSPGSDGPPFLPLILRREQKAAEAELFFEPMATDPGRFTLRLLFDDGTTAVQEFMGSPCNPYLRGPQPGPGIADARPGDDLNALAEKAGALRLAPGRYVLERPLKLSKPITISGDSNSTLLFTQRPDEPAWSGAILIGASHVTLRGFSIRFADNFRWDVHGRTGAGLIRAYDKPGNRDPKCGLVLENLDIESSTAALPANPAKPVEAPYIARLAGATSGRIVGNRFRGGTVDVANGPWLVARNEHRGTLPGTVAWDAFGGHWLREFTLENNRVHADGASGKMWRFISMNQLGWRVVIRSNDVSGVGMRDNDLIPNPNAPEILLTESYRLYFEGRPAAISSGGRILQIPMAMYSQVRAGSLVSILSGPHAGEYFPVAQPITPTTLLMANPLPSGEYTISIAHGFVDGLIEGNRIDVRGGASAVIVLAGNHWNFRVIGNHLLGGGDSLLVQSTPTENPFIWGWSHTPFLGFVGKDNVHEDSLRGVSIDVYANRHNKTTRERTYLTGAYENNLIGWSPATVSNPKFKPECIRIGSHSGDDSRQMKLSVDGNRVAKPAGMPAEASLEIRNAIIDNAPVQTRKLSLPAAPSLERAAN